MFWVTEVHVVTRGSRVDLESGTYGMPDILDTTPDYAFHRVSYEYRLIHALREIDIFLTSNDIPYCLFGGAAVAGYAQHFVRKLHDLDLIVMPQHESQLRAYLLQQGFVEHPSPISEKANYVRFAHQNPFCGLKASIFPGAFILLSQASETLTRLAIFDFEPGLRGASRKRILSLNNESSAEINVLRLEDLIITKLWPTVEATTIHDLLVLLSCTDPECLDISYIANRLHASPEMRYLYSTSLAIFKASYTKTVWHRFTGENRQLESVIELLESALTEPQPDLPKSRQTNLNGSTKSTFSTQDLVLSCVAKGVTG